jgi:release factor glutamine methyltransferase
MEFSRPLLHILPPGLRKPVRRTLSALAIPLLRRTILARTSVASVDGFTLRIPPGVFHPALFFSSTILGRAIVPLVVPGSRFADLGCGSGIIGLYAARGGASVTGLDINPEAVAATSANYAANFPGGSFQCVESDLFGALEEGERFDYIAWNPPFFPGTPRNFAEHAWKGGNIRTLLARCATGATAHLAPGGKVVILSSSDMNQEDILDFFPDGPFSRRMLRVVHSWLESFFVYEFSMHRS